MDDAWTIVPENLLFCGKKVVFWGFCGNVIVETKAAFVVQKNCWQSPFSHWFLETIADVCKRS
jgi:hypothetical protein